MRALALAAAFVSFAAPALAQSVDSVIAANRTAEGGEAWDGKASLTEDFNASGQGLTGTFHAVTDLVQARFADSFALGPATGANGYDGARAWRRDPSGQADYQEGGDERGIAIDEAYRRAHLYWRPDHGGAQITLAEKTDGGGAYDVLTVTPKDGMPFDMWIDAQTHLVDRVVEKQGTDTVTITSTDYRDESGVMLPHHYVETNGDHKYDTTLDLTKALFGPALPDSAYSLPTSKMDFSIAGRAHQTTVKFYLINNHIYTDVMLNGKGPYRLLVDTGGVNIVTGTVAKELGLQVQGQLEGRGAGEGRVDTGLTKIAEVRVGDAIVRDQVFAVFPFEGFADVEGVPEYGLIGYEVFRRFIARVDYGKNELTLIDPKYFDPKSAGVAVPFVFTAHIPTVKGTIDGIAGDFQIDTGSRSELTLTQPFQEAHKLAASHPKGVEAVTGWGVGGASRGYATYLDTLAVGGMTFSRPVTTLAIEKNGTFGDASYAGNIGGGLLKQYVVTFDYGHQTMYFAPGGIAERDGYDRAGLWMNRHTRGFEVMAVTKGAPADQAGVKIGDIIVSVDSKPATGIALPDLRKQLRSGAPGTIVHFGISHGGAPKEVAVTLRDLI